MTEVFSKKKYLFLFEASLGGNMGSKLEQKCTLWVHPI